MKDEDKEKKTEAQKEDARGRPHGREREEGDIDRCGQKSGIGGEKAGGGRPRDKKVSR